VLVLINDNDDGDGDNVEEELLVVLSRFGVVLFLDVDIEAGKSSKGNDEEWSFFSSLKILFLFLFFFLEEDKIMEDTIASLSAFLGRVLVEEDGGEEEEISSFGLLDSSILLLVHL
jgi:hypothetical protein